MNLFINALAGLLALAAAGAAFTQVYARRVERRYPPTGRFMEIEGCRLHYREEGPAGAPRGTVVLLHGASSNLVESMLGIGSSLTEHYRVIAVDRPGHGWSTRGPSPEDADPARQAAVVAEALRRLGVRDAVIVGHSWSGLVVPNFGLDHTDVAGAILVLSGITCPWPGGYMGWYKRLASSVFGILLTRTLAIPTTLLLRPAALKKTFAPQQPPPGFLDAAAIPLTLRPCTYETNGRDFAVMYDAALRQSARYGEIRLPVAIIGGDHDEIVWTDLHSRSLAREIPGAELIILPGIGHMPQYARPDLVLSVIESLAARVAAARVVGQA